MKHRVTESKCCVFLFSGLFLIQTDKFIGRVDIACNTSQSAFLKWQPGPGNVEYYQVEIKGVPLSQQPQPVFGLSLSLNGLTGGNYYEVNVSAVKCQRFLNPQLASFYTGEEHPRRCLNSNFFRAHVFIF